MHDGHRARLRERYLNEGLDSFAPHEVLELLLFYAIPRADTNVLAHRLISHFGSFAAVLEADPESLCEVLGIGKKTAVFLNLLHSASNYYVKNRWGDRPALLNTTDAGNYVRAQIGERTSEVFLLLCLDSYRRVIRSVLVSEGTVSETPIQPRKLAETALRHRACAVILAHNHPSGVLHPSDDDLALTRSLCVMFESLGINVIDHIIVAGAGFTSLAERGLMPN